ADLDEAVDRVIGGLERKSRVLSEKERDIVAHHEIGHALVATSLPQADPVHKVTIIPRGVGALGATYQLPLEDRYLLTRSELEDRIAVLLGGRAAEEVVYGEISTGAHNDLERATEMARLMVMQYGMSEQLGPMTFGGGRPGDVGRRGRGSRHAAVPEADADGGAGADRPGRAAGALGELLPGGRDGGPGRGQHQYGDARGGRPHTHRGVLRRGVLPPLLRRGPGARAGAEEPGLGGDRGSLRHRAHQCARGRARQRDRGGHGRRQEAQGQGGGRRSADRPRRAQAPGGRSLS